MPISTQLIRNGEPVTMPHGWGMWHVQVINEAAEAETGEKRSYWEPYTFTREWLFEDTSDGELFRILPGDRYDTWR